MASWRSFTSAFVLSLVPAAEALFAPPSAAFHQRVALDICQQPPDARQLPK
jgi:hypothetical protein